jgi:hypothetical protein
LEDEDFIRRIHEKIERLSGHRVGLKIDHQQASLLQVEMEGEVPLVVLGSNIFQYSGFARMGIEYAVACLRQQRPIDVLEFHLLLARN